MNQSHGIEADYYLYGVEQGILRFEEAIAWADKIIESEDIPSGEIIEVALSRPRGRNGVMKSLKEVLGERNPQVSGAMLLSELSNKLDQGESVRSVARKALNVAWATQLPEEVRWEFDQIDDELSLAEQGIYGDVEQCKSELINSLSRHKYSEKT